MKGVFGDVDQEENVREKNDLKKEGERGEEGMKEG